MSEKPAVSIVIVSYNMARELPRTVFSFLPPYQAAVEPGDVEILVVENGSPHPVPDEVVSAWPENVRYLVPDRILPSPAYALNYGVAAAKADIVCPVIDGARMASPGLVRAALDVMEMAPVPVVATVGLHLGREPQQFAVRTGYCQSVEDDLLKSVDWQSDGYRLFDISCFGRSATLGWFGDLAESNAPFLCKSFYEEIGGFDEHFDRPGGGLVNLDFFRRAVSNPVSTYYLLMGEGTFHQYHGGVTTSKVISEHIVDDDGTSEWDMYAAEYEAIRGEPWKVPDAKPWIIGRGAPFSRTASLKAMEGALRSKVRRISE